MLAHVVRLEKKKPAFIPINEIETVCLLGLVKIKEADDIEEKLNEVERLLKNAINMPCKVSC